MKKDENDLPGLTDVEKPRMRGPKRASKIYNMFNLSKEDDNESIQGEEKCQGRMKKGSSCGKIFCGVLEESIF
ncbi:hypothetical protein RYX36_010774 [Vicia faba]